ncbi:hypothetical protein HPP92_028878 [Vanilla planifolia]|uniref:Uncharacterized protein n=1 Tax=Vanilla planifolia TaxID=51239 RepID=A0A835U3F3_VANPL|nr:hypothetical protein HPP92_028878 [Vanilla planifolia]KAG0446365.1 hypothetical protein HPP92_028867 [Vanilla planifolia]
MSTERWSLSLCTTAFSLSAFPPNETAAKYLSCKYFQRPGFPPPSSESQAEMTLQNALGFVSASRAAPRTPVRSGFGRGQVIASIYMQRSGIILTVAATQPALYFRRPCPQTHRQTQIADAAGGFTIRIIPSSPQIFASLPSTFPLKNSCRRSKVPVLA